MKVFLKTKKKKKKKKKKKGFLLINYNNLFAILQRNAKIKVS